MIEIQSFFCFAKETLLMKNGIIIRKYEKKDLPSMITIWNEVVREGNAFPQEECLPGRTFLEDRASAGSRRMKRERSWGSTSCVQRGGGLQHPRQTSVRADRISPAGDHPRRISHEGRKLRGYLPVLYRNPLNRSPAELPRQISPSFPACGIPPGSGRCAA